MKKILSWVVLSVLLLSCSNFTSKKLSYSRTKMDYSPKIYFQENEKKFEAVIRLPKKFKDPLSLVVIVHEWWGRNDYIEKRAKMITDLGHAALAVDLYGDNVVVETPQKAQELATPFYQNPQLAVARLKKYLDMAKKDPHIDSKKIYVIGYCFGGTQALNLARSGEELKGVVSFHGGLGTSIKAKSINTKILVLNGKDDPMVPHKEVSKFEDEMKNLKVDYRLVNYQGALHAFTNPNSNLVGKKYNIPVAYNAEADKASWEEFIEFLKED